MASALDDLKAAAANVEQAINAAINVIQQQMAGGVSQADAEAVVQELNAAASNLNAAVNPSPAPASEPTS